MCRALRDAEGEAWKKETGLEDDDDEKEVEEEVKE